MIRSFIVTLTLVIGLSAALSGCTEQERARNWGGTTTEDLPAGERLVLVTWKEDHLWILTRPLREGETPETYTFRESSSWGMMQGTVTIRERAR